ncbi:MAG: extracellular solute-binding protein [Pseudomonadota bacterium]
MCKQFKIQNSKFKIALFFVLICLLSYYQVLSANDKKQIVLWHSYRATEKDAIEIWAKHINAQDLAFTVNPLAIPYDAFLDKVRAAIPRGKGPDLIIAAHNDIADWAEANSIAKLDDKVDPQFLENFFEILPKAMIYKGSMYGIPLSFKSLALFRNTKLVPIAPKTLSELQNISKDLSKNGTYGIVYETTDLYRHAFLLYGFGGKLFNRLDYPKIDSEANIKSFKYAMFLQNKLKVMPAEVNDAIISSLFNEGKAAFIIQGPWAIGEIDDSKVSFAVSKLPVVDVNEVGEKIKPGESLKPFLTVEAVMVSAKSKNPALAVEAAKLLATGFSAKTRLVTGKQTVSSIKAWDEYEKHVASINDPDERKKAEKEKAILKGFCAQLPNTVPIPNSPLMKALWNPMKGALTLSIAQSIPPEQTLAKVQTTMEGFANEYEATVEELDPTKFYIGVLAIIFIIFALYIRWVFKYGPKNLIKDIKNNKTAYAYAAPAMIGMFILVFIPFIFGLGMGFFKHSWGEYSFVGIKHFVNILTATDSRFFYTLFMTVLWTAGSVFFHVTIGIFLALVLNQARLKFKWLYRILFIIPWAVPSYITALIWKGMFHPEFGAINNILGIQGFSWMNQTWSAFSANLITNIWLGFPFMMVIVMGGLTAIPRDLYEAADIDGATWLNKLKKITLPLLRPVLAPAIILGTVWTFNMFNIIYLVSGGLPDGTTDILITEAFRWAFERGQGGAFGYAAAYSTLIFVMLVCYTMATTRMKKQFED